MAARQKGARRSEPVKALRHDGAEREESRPHEANFQAELADIGAVLSSEFANVSVKFSSKFANIGAKFSAELTHICANVIADLAHILTKLSAEFPKARSHGLPKIADVLPECPHVLFQLFNRSIEPANVNGHVTPLNTAERDARFLWLSHIHQL